MSTDRKHTKSRHGTKKRDTHFLCFPLVTATSVPQLVTSLARFQDLTCSEESLGLQKDDESSQEQQNDDSNNDIKQKNIQPDSKLKIIAKEAFRPPGTFHLTLGVMDLSRQEQMDRAIRLLNELDLDGMLKEASPQNGAENTRVNTMQQKHSSSTIADKGLPSLTRPISSPPHLPKISSSITSPTPQNEAISNSKRLQISLTGLSSFPNTSSARVLYAKPQDPTRRLHDFALRIRQKFREAGFITETRPLVLHATVANLRYAVQASAKVRGGGKRQAFKEEGQIDARRLIEFFDGGNSGNDNVKVSVPVSVLNEDAENVRLVQQGLNEEKEKPEFVWATGIQVDQLAICKLGATRSDDPVLGLVYPPVASRFIGVNAQEGDRA